MSVKISTTELYRLRHTQLAAQRAALKAQQAEQTLREMLLELEHPYGLLGTNALIDVHTGEVEATPPNGNRPQLTSPGQMQEHDIDPPLEGGIQEPMAHESS